MEPSHLDQLELPTLDIGTKAFSGENYSENSPNPSPGHAPLTSASWLLLSSTTRRDKLSNKDGAPPEEASLFSNGNPPLWQRLEG